MKVFIRKNATLDLGYEVVTIDDNNVEISCQPIVKSGIEKKTGILWYTLPENASNRKLINAAKITDGMVLEYRETRVLGPRAEGTGTKSLKWTDFLTDLEKETLELYKANCEARMQAEQERIKAEKEANKEQDKLDKSIARKEALIAKYQAELEALKGGNN